MGRAILSVCLAAWAAVAACKEPPEVHGLAGQDVLPGGQVQVGGRALGTATGVRLVGKHGVIALDDVRADADSVIGRVPRSALAGTYQVRVDLPAQTLDVAYVLRVSSAPPPEPCTGEYRSNTQISQAKRTVTVDRFYGSGERETVHVPIADVVGVELERTRTPAGEPCAAIFLRRMDGSRLLFADDSRRDLATRARRVAEDLGKTVEVTRDDAVGMADEEP